MDSQRLWILRIFLALVVAVILVRLFWLQVVDDRYEGLADNNVLRREVQYPLRGEVYDRNGEYLVRSREAYDLMVVPREIREDFDTMLFCGIVGETRESFERELARARNYSLRRPSVLFRQIPQEIKLQLDEYDFSGITPRYRTVRAYPMKIAGNLLGYVGEVNRNELDGDPYYRTGDYIGKTGIEKVYEDVLRGEKGVRVEMVDVHGVPKGSYLEGEMDVPAVPGSGIVSTIDAATQALAEDLMNGFVGSVVAIDPSTGEILAMVSSPSYDPDRLEGRERGRNYNELLTNPRRPLFNRAVGSSYPPGSTFKLVNALIALQEGIVSTSTTYSCHGSYPIGRGEVRCHHHRSPVDLSYAIQTSCNTYFCHVFRNLLDNGRYGGVKRGLDVWRDYVLSFGFGRRLDSDFTMELNGSIPSRETYDRMYDGRWNSATVLSLAIGQGEIGTTPLQMANFIATIANRGYYYIPHVVKSVEGQPSIDPRFSERHYTKVDKKHFDVVAEAMWKAVNVDGTGWRANIEGLDVCGKTGTAQNPHGTNHSAFACFAPLDNPRIAVSVFVENGGDGGPLAAPIARLVMEQYVRGEISREWYDHVKSFKLDYPAYGG